MNSRTLIFNIIFAAAMFTGCGGSGNTSNAKLPNTFQMTKEMSRESNLPEVAFSIDYPDGIDMTTAKPGVANDNYVSFIQKEDGTTEELTIGYLQDNSSGLAGMLLDQFNSIFLSVDPNTETVFKGKKDFHGHEAQQLQLRYEITSEEMGDIGKWMINIVLYLGNSGNGVILIFQTNDKNSAIKDFADFGKKGITGDMWKTFEME